MPLKNESELNIQLRERAERVRYYRRMEKVAESTIELERK